jgi:hypothetical protein
VRGVYFEIDRLSVDAFVRASDSVGLILDLSLDFLEVVEAAAWNMVELSPFILASDRFGCVRDVDCIIFGPVGALGRDVDELQYERPSCYDATAAREKVPADNVFEDGRFAGGLGADCDLVAVLATARHDMYTV